MMKTPNGTVNTTKKQFCTFTARSYGLHPFNSGQWTGTKGCGGGIEYGGSKRGRAGRMRWGGGVGGWGGGVGRTEGRVEDEERKGCSQSMS